MKVAIPVWQGNVSSVFDFADSLLLVEVEDGFEKQRTEVALTEKSCPERTAKLRKHGVNVLICGAISRPLAFMINSSGIALLPFVTGTVEQILKAYLTRQLDMPQYTLPGCWRGARRTFRRRRRRRCGRR